MRQSHGAMHTQTCICVVTRTWLRYGRGVACDEVRYRTTSAASVALPSWHGRLTLNAASRGAKSVQALVVPLRRACRDGAVD